ncbi:MAG: peptide-methionine (S)-S-oxide reductase MsrA [Chlamydiales bacterium]
MQPPYDALKDQGVIKTEVGYMGGNKQDPTYEEVSSGRTGHAEVVQVSYDPAKISYEDLLSVFWKNIDPTVKNRQFCDIGPQYRSVIFYHNQAQKEAALKSKQDLLDSNAVPVIYTEINPATVFYPAEEYHQEYYKKNPWRYKFYRYRCGRDARLEEVWGKDSAS